MLHNKMLFSYFILLHIIAFASARILPSQYAQLQYIRTMRDPLPVLVQATSNFSFNLLTNLGKSNLTNQSVSNAFFSPLGVVNTLAIMRLASSGKTRQEFNQLPIFQLPNSDVDYAFEELNKQIRTRSEKNDEQRIDISNFMFVEHTMKIKPIFVTVAYYAFQMETLLANFSIQPQITRLSINDFISNTTQGLIPNILSPSDVDAQTQVVLTNTIFFRKFWKNPFPLRRTSSKSFHLKDGTTVQVPMMTQTNSLQNHILCKRIGNTSSCRDQKIPDLVEIPFKGDNQTMVLLVPNKMVSSVEEIEDKFSAEINEWRAATKTSFVSLTMPKFKLEHEVDLKSALKEQGLQRVFDSKSSTFDHLTDQPLNFAKFVHKTSVIVEESGVTLAAASAATANLRLAPSPSADSIIVDSPFLFFVEDTRTKMILFVGRVNDPR